MTRETDLPPEVVAVREIPGVSTILDAVCRTSGVSFASIAHVTEARWVACAVEDQAEFGLVPGDFLPVSRTVCRDVRTSREPVIIDTVTAQSDDHQHEILASYGIRSYISVPILLPGGDFFGTLCGFSRDHCNVGSEKTRDLFRLFAELVGFNLQSLGRLRKSEAALEQEQEHGTNREKFIAVLIHELRNPLTALESGLRLLERRPERIGELIPQIRRVAARMNSLIRTTLDVTEIRFGSGLMLERSDGTTLAEALEQIIEEARTAFPEAVIRSELDCKMPVPCDTGRIAQLLANLLRNAISYGTPGTPIIVRVNSRSSELEMSVTNEGEPLRPEIVREMFKPFCRGRSGGKQHGLGLGLYIASEIAHEHGGRLDVETEGRLTQFLFRMPSQAPGQVLNPT
ncbi:ATP-binding protein [Acetobacter fallax]|uniref:histidine kinase n=1 Tax=Acetobacter fallax TaxID=1737473 RepID=A0ABX0KDR2_9PROT|nr:GAF domain-containing protein [Acetobacter fallax]NHO36192.1 GAF domain-containing protein [Acetobacter fallax]